jgi:hypothetical protein
LKINGSVPAGGNTDLAFLSEKKEALGRIDCGDSGYRLRKRQMNALESGQVFVVSVWDVDGAVLRTCSATRAFFRINVSWLLGEGDRKIPGFAVHALYLRIRYDFNIRVCGTLDKLGGQDAHGTVVGGKRLVELGHLAPNGRLLFHQIDFVS